MTHFDNNHTSGTEKQERKKRRKIWGRIAAFLLITALLAGIRCAAVWNDSSATGFDLFLFLYVCAAFPVGCIIQFVVVCDEEGSAAPWLWWM